MALVKKSLYFLVIICSVIGLYFSILGWIKFPTDRGIFIVIFFATIIGILIGIFEILNTGVQGYSKFYKIILGFLGGAILILAGIYLVFMANVPLSIKLFSIFGILFFSLCMVKITKKIKVEQDREILAILEYNNAFKKSKEILCKYGTKIIEENKEKGIIVARTDFSWKSFGEEIIINLKKINNNQTQVRILSKPLVSVSVVDFGKNLENVETFIKEIAKE